MESLDKKTLSLLSLLILPGILTMSLFTIKLIPIVMCYVGGYALGTLMGKTYPFGK